MRGYWQKVKFNAMTGYVSDIYLFSLAITIGGLRKKYQRIHG